MARSPSTPRSHPHPVRGLATLIFGVRQVREIELVKLHDWPRVRWLVGVVLQRQIRFVAADERAPGPTGKFHRALQVSPVSFEFEHVELVAPAAPVPPIIHRVDHRRIGFGAANEHTGHVDFATDLRVASIGQIDLVEVIAYFSASLPEPSACLCHS